MSETEAIYSHRDYKDNQVFSKEQFEQLDIAQAGTYTKTLTSNYPTSQHCSLTDWFSVHTHVICPLRKDAHTRKQTRILHGHQRYVHCAPTHTHHV